VSEHLYPFALLIRHAFAQRRFVAAMIRARPSGDRTRGAGCQTWLGLPGPPLAAFPVYRTE
jgi:hypothetical protein